MIIYEINTLTIPETIHDMVIKTDLSETGWTEDYQKGWVLIHNLKFECPVYTPANEDFSVDLYVEKLSSIYYATESEAYDAAAEILNSNKADLLDKANALTKLIVEGWSHSNKTKQK
jgi:hypothetical protein